MEDMSCQISVEGPSDREELAALVAGAANATLEKSEFETIWLRLDGVDIEVCQNDEPDSDKACEFPSGFLHFEHLIVFYGMPPLAVVGRVLTVLWERGYAAVAACDFENELPHAGGYKSLDVPWPGRERM